MRHQNPSMNMSVEEANQLRKILNGVGFIVDGLFCNPNVESVGAANPVPEINIPRDGADYHLEMTFAEGGPRRHNCTLIRDLLGDGGWPQIQAVSKTVYPHRPQAELASQLLATPAIAEAVRMTVADLVAEMRLPGVLFVECPDCGEALKPQRVSVIPEHTAGDGFRCPASLYQIDVL